METWRYVVTEALPPEMNMAIDEAILIAHSEGSVPPTIRFYTWNPATLSIGYFQKAENEIDMEQVKKNELGFVRRATGGRAVLHDKELTYSVIVSESHPKMPASVTDAYKVISTGLLHGFKELGLVAEMATLATAEEKEKYDSPGSSACFDSPSWYELVVEGRKVAGSAQTRQKGVILQHGSILLDMDVELLFSLLRFPSERVKQRMMESFRQKAVTINEISKHPVNLAEAIPAFRSGFSTGLKIQLDEQELSSEEWKMAKELAQSKYASHEWNYRR